MGTHKVAGYQTLIIIKKMRLPDQNESGSVPTMMRTMAANHDGTLTVAGTASR
jgi:hypothetical protein